VNATILEIQAKQLISLGDRVNIVPHAHNIGGNADIVCNPSRGQIFPSHLTRFAFECVDMTLLTGVGANQDQVTCNKRVAVETCLIATLFDVVAPVDTPRLAIESIEITRAGSGKQQLARNCGRGKHSPIYRMWPQSQFRGKDELRGLNAPARHAPHRHFVCIGRVLDNHATETDLE
jgi:hypothetical protein